MIEWKDEYSVHIEEIDEQHKKLFEIGALAEELILLPRTTDKFDDIIDIINQLEEYMIFHLNAEQQILERIKYNKYLSHVVMHNDFVEKMKSLDIHKIDEHQDRYLYDILKFIMEWLAEHVIVEDKLWAAYYLKNI